MARKRKRKRGRSWVQPSEAEAIQPAGPLPAAHAKAALDESCLSHPSFNLDYVCDDCAGGICRVCSISYRSVRLCSECFEKIKPSSIIPSPSQSQMRTTQQNQTNQNR